MSSGDRSLIAAAIMLLVAGLATAWKGRKANADHVRHPSNGGGGKLLSAGALALIAGIGLAYGEGFHQAGAGWREVPELAVGYVALVVVALCLVGLVERFVGQAGMFSKRR